MTRICGTSSVLPVNLNPYDFFTCKSKEKIPAEEETTKTSEPQEIHQDEKDKNWKKLSPFLNAYVKVFPSKELSTKGVWMLVWVKEDSIISHDFPVPKSSLIYRYLTSKNPDKQKIFEECENKLVSAYVAAKKFIAENKEVQTGFEIVGKHDYVMAVRGGFGIEAAYLYVDHLIENIANGNKDKAEILQNFFKGVFVHEMVHFLRGEIEEEKNAGKEIASHAVQFLSTLGNSPLTDMRFEEVIKEPEDQYDFDMISAVKVLQNLLIKSGVCGYKPKSIDPSELNKAILSIPEPVREETVRKIAQKIVELSPINLLRIAADVTVVPFDMAKSKEVKLEKVS